MKIAYTGTHFPDSMQKSMQEFTEIQGHQPDIISKNQEIYGKVKT